LTLVTAFCDDDGIGTGSQRGLFSRAPSDIEPTGVRSGRLRPDVPVETLLGRSVLDVGSGELAGYVDGSGVLVTGAGGSIGTELCRRLALLRPREVVLVDQAEAPLVGVARMLREELGFAKGVPVLADIKNRPRAMELLERHRPDVVIHAAAYKQVPLLEASPVEGAAANVLGTKNLVDASRNVDVERFVLFSTDKAVVPTSILGQTKRVAEWIVADAGREANGRYAAVRLGNVIDSSGSIVPVFRRQAAEGGPLTVTHEQATRYLMTMGEAAGLAIAAGAIADSLSVFCLDAGAPVPVVELARRVASAHTQPVEIEFIGLRPGERLHEHLFWPGDDVSATSCQSVLRAELRRADGEWLGRFLAVLARHVEQASAAGVRATLAEMNGAPEMGEVRAAAVSA
jgi:FlaA1/EpsC-like NDP-sugar epimerase